MKKNYWKSIFINVRAAFCHDVLWVPVAVYLSYWLRFNLGSIPSDHYPTLVKMIVVAVPVNAFSFWANGLYRGVWRFASIPDLIRIIKAISIGTLLLIGIVAMATRLEYWPRSVFILYPLCLFMGLAAPRLFYRWLKDQKFSLRSKEGKRTLIIGAGKSGELLLRDLIYREEYQPIAFVDDDQQLHGREILGVKVLGALGDICKLIQALKVELVIVAIPTIKREVVRKIADNCSANSVECRMLPAMLSTEKFNLVDQIRPITVEDLLGREQVHLDEKAIAGYLSEKTILVTGGGGSIGSELCRQIAIMGPKRLIVFDHGEYNLYAIDLELRNSFKKLQIETILGDIKNRDRVEWLFQQFKPDVVFHAAAYKHVPMLEDNPAEGVYNNIIGTKLIADTADKYHCDRFVLVSTDKAVNPANVMGTTKRIAELYCQNLAYRSSTKFITTRFGNVLGSTGSVVPLFEKQIKAGGPITVTHREITRYFMTIPEAASLILQAGAMGEGGEIFVLDMGEPVHIRELAEQMVKLSGLVPYEDIDIVYTGLRPGEKLYEEILHEQEKLQGTSHAKLLLAKSRKVDWSWLEKKVTALESAVQKRKLDEIRTHLNEIVPEYKSAKFAEVSIKGRGQKLKIVSQ